MASFGEYLDHLSNSKVLRATHMVLNGVAAGAGIFLLAVGASGLFDKYKVFSGTTLPLLSATLGASVAFVSFLGIAGSIKRSQHIFGTYSALLTLLVVVQVIGLLVIWLRPEHIEDRFGQAWEKLYEDDQDTIRYIEKDLQCCGFKSPIDMAVPKNCSVKKHYGFVTGCLEPLEHQWHAKRHAMLWAGLAIVGAQVVALLMGAELARRYKRARDGGYHQVPARTEGSPLLRA
ncbi:hypothetical protein LPJ73_009168 [Coemansia sp. RSA 2703]|nr:hypothetical protein LPJ73_009168 [Coemansia sp. RSA 2703]